MIYLVNNTKISLTYVKEIFGAADGNRTHTMFPPRDFKSLASACSATAAYYNNIIYYTPNKSVCQAKNAADSK